MKLIKLKPKKNNLFHIGEKDLQSTETIIHNDTLFSAICNNYGLLYGKELEWFVKTNLKLSSAFHYLDICRNDNFIGTIYFLPKPFIRINWKNPEEHKKKPKTFKKVEFVSGVISIAPPDMNNKIFKKVEFVSVNIFKKIQKNEEIEFNEKFIINGRYYVDNRDLELLGLDNIKDDGLFNEKKKQIKITTVSEESKVSLDRLNCSSKIFYQSNFEFLESIYSIPSENNKEDYKTKSGFYFLVNDEIDEKLSGSIKLIQDQGIGGKRSSGKGLFENVEFVEGGKVNHFLEILEFKEGNKYINISLVFPKKDEVDSLDSYSLIERKGFIFSQNNLSLRKKSIRMVKEGSVFSRNIEGEIKNVAPDGFSHDVLRHGLAFLIPIKYEEKQND